MGVQALNGFTSQSGVNRQSQFFLGIAHGSVEPFRDTWGATFKGRQNQLTSPLG